MSDFVFRDQIKGVQMELFSHEALFSPEQIDDGTQFMMSVAKLEEGQHVLDLGCGYGAVGIYAAKIVGTENVVMSDVVTRAVELAKKNAAHNGVPRVQVFKSDGFRDLPEMQFDVILSNPPYHANFSVAKHFIEEGFRHLNQDGYLYMVTHRLDWYKNKIKGVFGGVQVHEKDGYYVFVAQKRSEKPVQKQKENKGALSKKLERKATPKKRR